MNLKIYRQNIHDYVTSMTIFQKLYLEVSLSDRMYELIKVKIANKYSIPIVSTLLSQISWSNNLTILSSTKTRIDRGFQEKDDHF